VGSVGAGSEKRNGRAGLAVDGQLVAGDVDSVDQEAEVVFCERLVGAEEEVADGLLESGDRRRTGGSVERLGDDLGEGCG
jgi:hypothetical protein